MAEKMQYAKDFKCCVEECGEQAVCFWPMVDPDIPHHPYCRKHVDEAKERVMMEVFQIPKPRISKKTKRAIK